MYNLDEATLPQRTIISAIKGIKAAFKYKYRLIVKVNSELMPIICKLTLKCKKVSTKASIEAIKPPSIKK